MKILIFGASGMIGHKMYMQLQQQGHDVYGTLHHSLKKYEACTFFKEHTLFPSIDVTDAKSVTSVLEGLKPDAILNCVGVTLRKPEIKDFDYCAKVNSEFPHFLKNWAQKHQSYLIHFSTDCVFNGSHEFYTEESKPDATDIYGRTKALGEVIGENVLTLRGSQLGPEVFGKSELFEWALLQKSRTIKGFTGAIYSGVTTNVMCDLVAKILSSNSKITGLYHVSSEPISKYELLKKINLIFDLKMTVLPDDGYHTRKVLTSQKIAAETGFYCPSWDAMINQLLLDRKKNTDLYGG